MRPTRRDILEGLGATGVASILSVTATRRAAAWRHGNASQLGGPVLAMDPAWTSAYASPLFSVQASWLDLDDLQFEYRVVGAGSWTIFNRTVFITNINGATIDLAVPRLSNANYEARCKFKHLGDASYSAYSNVQTFTISAPPLPVKVWRDSRFTTANGSVTDFTNIDVGGGNCLLIVQASWLSVNGITSIVFDPAGANVTLTQDAYIASGDSAAVYSGVIPSVVGAKTIRLTLINAAFFQRGISVSTVTGLLSPTKKQSGGAGNGSIFIPVTEEDIMFGALYNDPQGSTRTFSGSTQAPDGLHSSDITNQFPDWSSTTTNPNFAVVPGGFGRTAVATYGNL